MYDYIVNVNSSLYEIIYNLFRLCHGVWFLMIKVTLIIRKFD